MNETELYKELGVLTKNKDKWRESIPYVSSLLKCDSVKIKAKALWLLSREGADEFMKSILIKDTTREEREAIVRASLDCGGGCENCSSCWLGGGSPWDIYQDYIDGKREIKEINMSYMEEYRQNRQIT